MTPHTIVRNHTVTGTATQLANLVVNHRTAGTLVAMTTPRRVGHDRFQVVIRLREYQPARPTITVTSVGEHTRTQRSRRTRIAVIVTAVTGVLTGIATAVAYLIGQLVELIAVHASAILGVLALVAILAAAAALRSSSGRRHCPGC